MAALIVGGLLFGGKKVTKETFTEMLNQVTAESVSNALQDCSSTNIERQNVPIKCTRGDADENAALRLAPFESNTTCKRAIDAVAESISLLIKLRKESGTLVASNPLPPPVFKQPPGTRVDVIRVLDKQLPTVEQLNQLGIREEVEASFARIRGTCKSCIMTDIDLSAAVSTSVVCVMTEDTLAKVRSNMVAKIEQFSKTDKDFLASLVGIIPTGDENTSVKTWAENKVASLVKLNHIVDMSNAVKLHQNVEIIDSSNTIIRGITENVQVKTMMENIARAQVFNSLVNGIDFDLAQRNLSRNNTIDDVASAAAAAVLAAERTISKPLTIGLIIVAVFALLAILYFMYAIFSGKNERANKVTALVKRTRARGGVDVGDVAVDPDRNFEYRVEQAESASQSFLASFPLIGRLAAVPEEDTFRYTVNPVHVDPGVIGTDEQGGVVMRGRWMTRGGYLVDADRVGALLSDDGQSYDAVIQNIDGTFTDLIPAITPGEELGILQGLVEGVGGWSPFLSLFLLFTFIVIAIVMVETGDSNPRIERPA